MLVLDASRYTGEISPDTIRRLHQRGYRGLISQVFAGRPNRYFHQHMDAAATMGWGQAGYYWPASSWRSATDFLDGRKLAFLAPDVERGIGSNADPTLHRRHLDGIWSRGYWPIIYTGVSAWRTIMGNTLEFKDDLVWLARYPYRRLNASDPTRIQTNIELALGGYRLGGWSASNILVWQFQNTTNLEGEQFDLNLVRKEAFTMASTLDTVKDKQLVSALYLQAAGAALDGKLPPKSVRDRIIYLQASWPR